MLLAQLVYIKFGQQKYFTMDSKLFYIVLICLLCYGQGQQCRNKNNWRVDWWVIIQFPGSVSTGYAYFDSRFAAPTFAVYTQEPDSATTPLNKTLNQIANLSMYSIAWNDQAPNGSESTTKAHSKSVGAYDPRNQSGFFLIHSIPQYPSFVNGLINSTISPSQQIYGQHILCISVDKALSLKLLSKLFPIRPFVYSQLYNSSQILYQVIHSANTPPDYDSYFSYLNWQKNGTEWSMIFKNGYKNSSLFEDGVNEMLGSGLLSQTWGRPLQAPWCGGNYPTGNVKQIKLNENITWSTTQDHSKWIVSKSTNHSCFGDMNRMESQWGRGGAFYCIKSPLLNQAMKGIIKTSEECATA